ncbi:MAG: DUF2934 domain-containing protein [Bryobacteraceae bacterium]|jgi:hypothetical protein
MARKRISEKDLVVSTAAPAAVRRKPSTKRAKHSASPVEIPSSAPNAAVCEPSHDEIARLAYSYWEARGCRGGSSEEDWLRAERELRGV